MKLPIGIQDFAEIREGGYLYVDKTENIYRIVTDVKHFFLSRPRRFGKSLLLSTMRALYEGRRDLFEGLWIEKNWNWERSSPVIHIQFAKIDYQTDGLEQALYNELKWNGERLGISIQEISAKSHFFKLIYKVYQKYGKVVILIDEYDKPIIDYLDDIPQARNHRQILKTLYSVLKDSDPYIELLFITGVSRFAKASIFSDLNNLLNLTLDFEAVQLLGITQDELLQHFTQRLETIAKQHQVSFDVMLNKVQDWYNGYSWDGKVRVYNPFSLLSFMRSGAFDNFWFETGTPTFLVKKLTEAKHFNIEKMRASDLTLNQYNLENINPLTILFQTGYLTIQKKQPLNVYDLSYPNREVQLSLEEHLFIAFSHNNLETGKTRVLSLMEALYAHDLEAVIVIINASFASIPYQLWQKDNESFFHALIHLLFSIMGAHIQSEVNSLHGRLDAKVETEDTIYIFEFKLDQSADIALQQIEEKGYFTPYLDIPKRRLGVGVSFSKEEKKVNNWAVREW